MFLQMAVVYFLTRRRTIPDMASRAPADALARREVWLLWTYGSLVLIVGRWIGLRFFGEGIGLHLNGSLFGMTRMVSPQEVWVWAFYNFVLLAVIPYVIFRARGYSREALNLKSANLANDTLVILVVMAIGSAVTTALVGRLSYAALHIFEYWTVFDSLPHALLSVIFVLLTFVPPGLMKSYLTLRTANAWVHLWGFHAITPHVTADTPMVVK